MAIRLKFKMDTNGNKTVQVIVDEMMERIGKISTFSIQTNGNLPYCHKFHVTGNKDLEISEIKDFVEKYGTNRQRKLMGVKPDSEIVKECFGY